MKKTAWAFVDYAAHCHDDNDLKKVEVGYLEIKSGVDHQIAHARVAFQYLLQAIDTTFCHCQSFCFLKSMQKQKEFVWLQQIIRTKLINEKIPWFPNVCPISI